MSQGGGTIAAPRFSDAAIARALQRLRERALSNAIHNPFGRVVRPLPLAGTERCPLLECNEDSLCTLFAVMSFREASALRRTCMRLYYTTLSTGFTSFWRRHRSAAERRDIDRKSAVAVLPLMEGEELEAATLETHGFCVLHMDLTDEEAEAVKDAHCPYPIPNAEDETGIHTGDQTRTQSHHQLRGEVKDIKERVRRKLEDAGHLRTSRSTADCANGRCCVTAHETRQRFWCCKRCVNARVLKSVPGPSGRGDDQPAHCDAAPPRSFEGGVAAPEGVHNGYVCDGSGISPIIGVRYHLTGDDFDLCAAEYAKLSTQEQEKYERIEPTEFAMEASASVPEDWPLSVLLAVQEDTYLAIRKRGDAHFTLLRYGVGDMIVFRGDICHYGVGYDCENSRLHFYIDSFMGRPPNTILGGC